MGGQKKVDLRLQMEAKLNHALSPKYLEIVNESDGHNVPPGSQTHFKVVVASDVFDGQTLVRRHQHIYRLLEQELSGGVHALALHTYTAEEWREKSHSPASPACQGGGAKPSGDDRTTAAKP